MTQLDDFKRVLGLDENYQDRREKVEENSTPNQTITVKEEIRDGQRRTVSIPGDMHTRICLLGIWMNNTGIKDNPRMYEIVSILIDDYLEHHPEAADYVRK